MDSGRGASGDCTGRGPLCQRVGQVTPPDLVPGAETWGHQREINGKSLPSGND